MNTSFLPADHLETWEPRAAASGEPDGGGFPDLIFVSLEDWDEIWRRNQFVCDELARRFPSAKILFVAPPRDVSNQLRRGHWRALAANAADKWTVPGTRNITVVRPLKLLPNSLAVGRWFNAWLARRQVQGWARCLGLRSPVLWLNDHYAVHMVGKTGEHGVIYDVTDDWIEFAPTPRQRRLTQRSDARLCAVADAVITCSERLHRDKQKIARTVHLIPNGVDPGHYDKVLDSRTPLPSAAAAWPRPVAGYVGTVHPSRVDVPLVASLARRCAPGSVVLLGPDHLTPADRALLAPLENVFLVPAVPYAEVPDYMRAFDVCLVPHVVTPFTESLNPIKLWEYLAAGKPIVSTRVAGFRDYPEHVYLANNAAEFAEAVALALDEPKERSRRRKSTARLHSWSSRVDRIVRVVRACAKPPAVVSQA